MSIVKPLELGVVVSDLEAAEAFYGGLLGLIPERRVTIGAAVGARTGVSGAGFTVSRYKAPCGAVVKLLHPAGATPEPGADAAEICSRATTAFLTLVVDNLRELVKQLQASGVRVRTRPAIVEVRPGMHLAFVEDPDGFPVELVQYD
ncbi:MAG: VOC family protein [Chromatocurvus sp.]